jgi:hypothetical protein
MLRVKLSVVSYQSVPGLLFPNRLDSRDGSPDGRMGVTERCQHRLTLGYGSRYSCPMLTPLSVALPTDLWIWDGAEMARKSNQTIKL